MIAIYLPKGQEEQILAGLAKVAAHLGVPIDKRSKGYSAIVCALAAGPLHDAVMALPEGCLAQE